ncbi:MAG: rhomboid family intramembrane serine protease [Paludibacter sp.]|nr:rhomboid family intramembrane serine protease [Paludibacter sp.]
MLVHRNLYHLFMNMLVYYQLYNVVGKKVGSDAAFVIPFFISFVASFMCEYSLPTIGASGLVYTLMGMFFILYRLETKTYIFNAVILSISGTVGYFTHVNVKLHLICFVFGILSGVVLNENIFGRLLKWFKRSVC